MPKLEDLELKIKQTTANTQGIEKLASALSNLGASSRKLGTVGKEIQQLGDAVSTTSQKAEQIDSATAKVNKFKETVKAIGKGTSVAISHVGNAIKKVGTAALTGGKALASMGWEKLKSKVSGLISPLQNLIHSFARIAMYRALRTAIKAITTGFSEGIKHLYEWSRVMDNTFKNSMDSLSTSAHYLRDSLGAMASPLIDALAPAVEFVVEKFVSLLNVVNQFIATFTGASSWRRAVRTPTEYSSGLEDAAKSAKKATEAQKKLNKSLMDFDELNLITTSTTKGSNPSSPSGSGGGEDYGTHFVEEPIADWIQAIKDAINNGDWYGAGQLLADKLNSIVDGWDARAWGQKIGQKIENGLKFYLGFMDNFKWEGLGTKVADAFNGIFDKIDPEDLGRAMVAHLKAAVKFAKGFFTTADFAPIGEALGAAFNELFSREMMVDLGTTIGSIINDAVDLAVGFVTTADWSAAGHNIMESLFTAIRTIDWGNAGGLVADLATGLLDAILSAIDYAAHHLDEIFFALIDFVGSLLGHLWNWLVDKVSGLVGDFLEFLDETLFGGNKDDGNNRKDGPVSMTPTSVGSSDTGYTAKVNVLYESNASSIMDEIKVFDKMSAKPQITFQTPNYTTTNNAINKMVGNRTVLIYANKDKKTFDAITKAIKNLTIDRTATIKFKPVVETSGNKANKTTLLSEKQLSKMLSLYATGGFPTDDLTAGSLFVAGESGAELVGNINGKTGVASGKEITGIADAVYNTGETEAELLRQQNSLLRQILAKSTTVNLAPNVAAGKWVNQAQAAYARATG